LIRAAQTVKQGLNQAIFSRAAVQIDKGKVGFLGLGSKVMEIDGRIQDNNVMP
jgi:hypothetical protein